MTDSVELFLNLSLFCYGWSFLQIHMFLLGGHRPRFTSVLKMNYVQWKQNLGVACWAFRVCDGVWKWNKVLEILGNNVPRASTPPVSGEQRSRWTLPAFRASDSNQGFLLHRWTKRLRSAADEPGCTVLCNHVGIFKCLFSLTLLFWGFLHRNWGLHWGCWCVAHRAILVPFDCSCQKNKP